MKKNYITPFNLKAHLWVFILVLLVMATSIAHAQNAYVLKKDDFYKVFKKTVPSENATIVHHPISLDEKMFTEFFYQGREAVFQPLIDSMNCYLDSLGWSTKAVAPLARKGAPYLFVGSSEAETAPHAVLMMREEHDMYPPMALFLDKPSKEWRKSYIESMDKQQGEYALMIWVGLTEYPKANKGVFKKKVVLGTGYEHEIRFLSAVDKPVEVLQLTGVLIDREGNILRAGAEGFLHEDSPFWVQTLNAGTTVDDHAVRKLFTEERREDLPGKPLAWRVGLTNLMEQLTERPRYY